MNRFRTGLLIGTLCTQALLGFAQEPVKSFPLREVRLLPGAFKEAEQTDLQYIMAMDPDRLLAPYRREAGLPSKVASYGNWENTGLDGHMGGHYLTALSLMAASTGDKRVQDRLTYMVAELKRCQDQLGTGYVGGVPGGVAIWKDIAQGKIDAGTFSLNSKWVPLYNIHKTFAGLRDAYLVAGNEQAKTMLIRLADWMIQLSAGLSDEQIQNMLRSEHGGLNEVFADVSFITGDKKYLELARRYSHRVILDPLVEQLDRLNGLHANTQIPKVIGFERIAELSEDSAYHRAARFFWETVVKQRTVAIGGNSVSEHFNPANNFSSMISRVEGPETCNTYNMLKLTKQLYEAEGKASYLDYYERALYNHILSTQRPGTGGFVYFTPMRPRHYRVYSQVPQGMWCCVGSGLENHGKYGEMIYAHRGNDLYVNLFIPSQLNWKEQGVMLTQQTKFPDQESTRLTLTTTQPRKFTLNLRYPSWVAAGALSLKINGKKTDVTAQPGSYIALERTWKKGDQIEITLPMQTTTEALPDGSNYVAFLRGPIVLAAKTDTTDLNGLLADDSRMGHIAAGKTYPLQQMPLLVSTESRIEKYLKPVPGKSLTYTASELLYPAKYRTLELIPFYRLHDARYVIYWQKQSPEGLQKMQEELARQEAIAQQLAAITLDVVYAGEQQPESDHFVKSEKSNTGQNQDRHWRDARGWFSYQLKNPNQQADRLQVTYWGKDRNRKFKILLNDQPLATVEQDGQKGEAFYTEEYAIPASQNAQAGPLTVKFLAEPGSATGGIYEVRLLKK